MSRRLVLLLAVACGAAVANLYYAQPLLHVIADGLGVSATSAALLITASQVGYAIGLVALVPLGDLVDRRLLVARLLVVTAAALAAAAAAPSLAVLGVALAVVGVTSVVAQVLVPLASALADEDERGAVVGAVMSGLLLGILLARTVSGLVAALGGWRLVFALAAGLMLVLAAVLARVLPSDAGRPPGPPYGRLLRSVGTLIREEPVLRRRMAYGACGMAGFSALWTSLALLLGGGTFDYGEATIGLFGLAGLAGAAAAQVAGRLVDRGRGHAGTLAFLLAIVAGWAVLLVGRDSAVAIIAGLVVLDLGVQGQHIVNQSTIYTLRPDARSRLTTAYMTGNFTAGALASAASAWAWSAGGWAAVCALGGGIAVLGVLLWGLDERAARGSDAIVVAQPREDREHAEVASG